MKKIVILLSTILPMLFISCDDRKTEDTNLTPTESPVISFVSQESADVGAKLITGVRLELDDPFTAENTRY